MGKSTTLLGIAVSTVASLATAIGFVLEKKAHNRNQQRPIEARYPTIKLRLWWFGFFFDLVIAGVLNAMALSLADQMVLAPLAGLTLVFNAILSAIFLDESMPMSKIVATAFIIVGTTFTTLAGISQDSSGESKFLNLSEIYTLLQRAEGITFLAVAVSLIVTLHLLMNVDRRVMNPDLVSNPNMVVYPAYVPLVFSAVAGLAAALQQLCLKCLAELTAAGSDNGKSPFQTPYPYIILLCGVAMGLIQITYVNEGMKRFHNTVFIPVYNAAFIIFNILTGALFFAEADNFTTISFVYFGIGSLCAIVGQLQLLWSDSEGKEVMKEAVKHGRVSIAELDHTALRAHLEATGNQDLVASLVPPGTQTSVP